MFKIVNFKNKNVKELPAQKVCLDFALAEFSSAIEMLQASKKVDNTKLAIGFLRHCLDEYRHTNFFKSLISANQENNINQSLLFNPVLVYQRGFINEKHFLFDEMNLDQFSVFIGVNEKQALNIFKKLNSDKWELKSVDKKELDNIIKEEENHAKSSSEVYKETFKTILIDEEKHARLALSFAKSKIETLKYNFLYYKYLLLNKIRHLIGNSEMIKKILSHIIAFLLIILSYPFKYALSTRFIKNDFHLDKKNANLIL